MRSETTMGLAPPASHRAVGPFSAPIAVGEDARSPFVRALADAQSHLLSLFAGQTRISRLAASAKRQGSERTDLQARWKDGGRVYRSPRSGAQPSADGTATARIADAARRMAFLATISA